MTSIECLYLDKSDIPTHLYEELYNLASFSGGLCESFFVRTSYIDSYIEDMKNDSEIDYSDSLPFYEDLSKKLWDYGCRLLFICNDEDLEMIV